ncbi:glycosyltransferase family 4 protein [Methanocalculus taiwanensis]|uniref:Glycosyltransferase family 4 protein n=1 Tax=Methanocalculus taiwanensis TaxID=106207 RepID=A0ABD4TQF3_9EURY|nr:glycosyltransferase [Methanocalculus taiwanensis]MCQ1539535.1 glycosyltransferase family 4 protein [Methanocalculus taiwanensis]
MGKSLLVCAHSYSNFQKEAINLVSDMFDFVNVIVRTNTFVEIGKHSRMKYFKPYSSDYKIDLKDKPQNVNIYPVSIPYLPTDRGYKLLGEKHLYRVKKLINENNINFDLIHSHFTWSAGYVGAKLKEEYGVPFVVNARGYDIYSLPFKDDEWRSKITYVLETADQIITTSESNLPYLKKLYITSPIHVIPNGFRDQLFYPRDIQRTRIELGLPSSIKILLAIGSLREIKGHKYLIGAMSKIKQFRDDVICVIVGEGELQNELQKIILSYGLQDLVFLKGGKPHHQIPDWLNSCDLFILPSLQESYGTVQVEAMACGKPVIATKNGGSEWIINSDKYGILVEPSNSEDLADKILVALDKEWDKEAILKYAEQFNWNKIAVDIKSIYDKII